MISNASRFIDAYLGAQQAGTVTVEEWFDTTFFGQHIVCGIRPVQSISSIKEVKGDLVELRWFKAEAEMTATIGWEIQTQA